ncbi:hypothetical protein ACNH6B_16350 [Shewanella basaltis]
MTSLTVDFSQSIDLYRYQYISYPELRLVMRNGINNKKAKMYILA